MRKLRENRRGAERREREEIVRREEGEEQERK
jgi:hypothetical protein